MRTHTIASPALFRSSHLTSTRTWKQHHHRINRWTSSAIYNQLKGGGALPLDMLSARAARQCIRSWCLFSTDTPSHCFCIRPDSVVEKASPFPARCHERRLSLLCTHFRRLQWAIIDSSIKNENVSDFSLVDFFPSQALTQFKVQCEIGSCVAMQNTGSFRCIAISDHDFGKFANFGACETVRKIEEGYKVHWNGRKS